MMMSDLILVVGATPCSDEKGSVARISVVSISVGSSLVFEGSVDVKSAVTANSAVVAVAAVVMIVVSIIVEAAGAVVVSGIVVTGGIGEGVGSTVEVDEDGVGVAVGVFITVVGGSAEVNAIVSYRRDKLLWYVVLTYNDRD